MIVLDTSGLLAAIDSSQDRHRETARALMAAEPPRLLSPFVLAELDRLLGRHVGRHAQEALLGEVERGAYRLEPFDATDIAQARSVAARYVDLALELADASIVVLASRFDVLDVLTLDERHFRAVEGPGGAPFRILPADAGSPRGR